MTKGDDLKTFGGRLKAAREAARLSQRQLAKAADLDQSQISKLEGNAHKGSPAVAQLAAAAGVEALWLATGEEPRKRAPGALDADLLRHCMMGLEMDSRARKEPVERRAEMVAALYRMFSKSGGEPDPQEILHFLRTMF